MNKSPEHPDKYYWIVVADEAHAVFYTRDTRSAPMVQLLSLENETARKKIGDLFSDRGGRSFDSFGAGRHTMTAEKTDPKMHAAQAFAKQIAERIGKATHDGSCRDYALVAAPRFLGLLRDAVAKHCKFEPYLTIDKDVVARDAAFLQKLVDGH